MRKLLFALVLCMPLMGTAQVITILEDLEGMADDQSEFPKEGVFGYGGVRLRADQGPTTGSGYSGHRALRVTWTGSEFFGGWGIGLGLLKELDRATDHFCFFIRPGEHNAADTRLKVLIQEEDHGGGLAFDTDLDDVWGAEVVITGRGAWQKVCIPLTAFEDMNEGGDGVMNMSHHEGRIHAVLIDFQDVGYRAAGDEWHFDFLCFSRGELPTADGLFTPVAEPDASGCAVGAWSEEGDVGDFMGIPVRIESMLNLRGERKLDVVSFYKPMSVDGGTAASLLPPVDELQALIASGYLPMITLEAQFTERNGDKLVQPNLYSINEGWFDHYFADLARRIAPVEGTVLVRILHEFNGDWYPWCIAMNDRDPQLYIAAFRRVVDLFRHNGAENVRFVWCPNATSTPMAGWNFVMDAYPGDDHVDLIGIDVFNGAGQPGTPVWRSFEYLMADLYFLFRERLPHKPIVICETSSRERMEGEEGHLLQKADWVRAMGASLRTNHGMVRLVTWFNQYDAFKLDSSRRAEEAFRESIWEHPYFNAGEAGKRKLSAP